MACGAGRLRASRRGRSCHWSGPSRSTTQSVAGPPVAQPVVQPAAPALPELHRLAARPAARPSAAGPAPARRREPLARPRPAPPPAPPGPATTCDCGLAQAPSCEPRGRVAKYASVSARSTRSTAPGDEHLALHREPREDQARRTGWRRSSVALARVVVGEEHEARARRSPLSSTVRALGRPCASAVATTIAFGSGSPTAAASANQRRELAGQSAARSASSQARRGRSPAAWRRGRPGPPDAPARRMTQALARSTSAAGRAATMAGEMPGDRPAREPARASPERQARCPDELRSRPIRSACGRTSRRHTVRRARCPTSSRAWRA